MKANLFINWYIDRVPERRQELVMCLLANFRNPQIDTITIVVSEEHFLNLENILEGNGLKKKEIAKLRPILRNDRPHYNCFFRYTREYPDDINIIANTDIVICSMSLAKLKTWNFKNYCLALSRWDYYMHGMNPNHSRHHANKDSQDTWIVKGGFPDMPKANFPLGMRGCDNRIAFELSKRYQVINPSQTIRTFHYHITGVHNYAPHGSKEDLIPPPYRLLPVQKLPA